MNKNINSQRNSNSTSKNINREIISTNIDSKEVNNINNFRQNNNIDNNSINNQIYFYNEMSKKYETIINKINNETKNMQNLNQRMDFIQSKLKDFYNSPNNNKFKSTYMNNKVNMNNNVNNENNKINEEYETNPEALKEVMDYYQNMTNKNNNENPVEIFEDVNNHVEDIRQEVMQNNNGQNINRNEIIEIYSHNYNNLDNMNSNDTPGE